MRAQVIEQLIEKGGDVNVFDRSGITPLHYSGLSSSLPRPLTLAHATSWLPVSVRPLSSLLVQAVFATVSAARRLTLTCMCALECAPTRPFAFSQALEHGPSETAPEAQGGSAHRRCLWQLAAALRSYGRCALEACGAVHDPRKNDTFRTAADGMPVCVVCAQLYMPAWAAVVEKAETARWIRRGAGGRGITQTLKRLFHARMIFTAEHVCVRVCVRVHACACAHVGLHVDLLFRVQGKGTSTCNTCGHKHQYKMLKQGKANPVPSRIKRNGSGCLSCFCACLPSIHVSPSRNVGVWGGGECSTLPARVILAVCGTKIAPWRNTR